jgi:hypothetical protein
MAPELMTDEEVGTCDIPMADVYVFGILMWAVLITRTEPHDKVCKEQRAEAQYMATCKPRVPFCPPPPPHHHHHHPLPPPPPPPPLAPPPPCAFLLTSCRGSVRATSTCSCLCAKSEERRGIPLASTTPSALMRQNPREVGVRGPTRS